MLFLERFLPTNGVRACTAAVTEIAWNGSDDPQEYFRAEVEFISRENWKHELGILLGDLVGENCELSKDYLNEETEAGVAYAKLKAVYPDKTRTKEMVAQCLAQELLEVPEVQKLLGKTKKINAPDAETFRGALQRYLDSNEKIGTAKREKKSMAFWPLVKVVRVYCKADVLSTGLVIADLPGVQDANAARSAVADKYLAECSALCVVSPITRAADDKVAKNLLSKSFRRQLKMDGIYSNVIFICTKTDDVSVRESLDSFDSGPIQATIAREKEIKEALHVETEALGELKTQQNLTEVREEQLSRDHVVWKRLQKRAEKGQEVHAPHKTPQKRKRPTQPITRRKGARPTLADSDSDEDEQIEQPLTLDQIRTEMNRFDEELEQANDELAQLQEQVTAVKGRISGLGIEKEGIISQRVALCIKMRNDYAREAIKADFAAGIREIDEDDAAGEDGQDFDPSKLKRDYNEVARSLPVFCISNRAFEQVWEGAQIESPIQGFRTLDETEIPQLKEHAKGLTENMRLLKSKTFLNDFMALLTSLLLWVESEGSGLNLRIEMGDKEQGYEIKHLNVSLDTLDRDLKDASQSLVMHLLQAVDQGVTKQSSTAVKAGTSAVISVARSWGEKTSEGGVHWGTYKAICRRSGEKTKAKTARNFNEEILEPYQQKIATDWERIFAEEVPRILDDFVRECGKLLQEFHHAMSGRPELERCKAVPLALLGQQIRSHVHAIQDLGATSKLSIQGQQREAGRLFLPHIKMTMQKGYNDCAAVTGKGCFLNMKKIMENYVEKVRTKLYRNAAAKVRTELERGFRDVGSDATAKLREIVSTMGKDYKSVILGSEIIEASHMARDHIRQLLPTVDSRFRDVLGFEIRNADSKDVPLAQFAASMVNTQAL
ncbi:Nuclear GTPase SLIP-GC [Pleurostoma richardsiae]|uniref:Nuclear GTPase SLIP-GC n=1 Tax=Pleurostoma richardsiae TaxID=41990 RepID=A0AA38RQF7_9PEZI|nr:Nuclear GTPase SLIP-GC [Pleurostoma richardsiae]